MGEYIIAHDLGTSGDKAVLFDTDGNLLKSVQNTYTTRFFKGVWAEQNPESWWEAFCKSNHELLESRDVSEVSVVGFSGQMMGCVAVDRKGRALRNAMIWADQRAEDESRLLREKLGENEFYKLTGHRISPSYSLEKLMWIQKHEPDIFSRIYKMLQPKDYIVYRLTGQFLTDYSDASGTNAFDIGNLCWSEKILDCAEIPLEMMPRTCPSTYVAGEVPGKLAMETGLKAGTQIVIGGGDGVCASVGAASIRQGLAYNYLGSSAWISFTSKEPVLDEEMRTFNWVHMVPGYYAPTGTMQAAGNAYEFARNNFYGELSREVAYQQMDKDISLSGPGAGGLIFLPYLLGERSPRWNPQARGVILGLKMEHTRADMMRAVVEGILMNLEIILRVFKKHCVFSSINIFGGMAKSPEVCRVLSQIFGMEIHRMSYLDEATSVGAAVAAGVGTGKFSDFNAVDRFTHIEETIKPFTDGGNYKKLKVIFEESYKTVEALFPKLSGI